jgi:hypothetical protein
MTLLFTLPRDSLLTVLILNVRALTPSLPTYPLKIQLLLATCHTSRSIVKRTKSDIVWNAIPSSSRLEDGKRHLVRDSVSVLYLVPTLTHILVGDLPEKKAVHLEIQSV